MCLVQILFSYRSIVPVHVLSIVQILMFVIAVLLHGRQVEWTARLDFLWQIQANEEKQEMDALQHSNKRILFNLLPAHVATHFLDNQFRNNMVSRNGAIIQINKRVHLLLAQNISVITFLYIIFLH